MAACVPLVKQVWSQGPRFQIDDDLALVFEKPRIRSNEATQLRVEWTPGSRYEALGSVSQERLDEWVVRLAQGLNHALGECLPSVRVPELRP